MRRFLIVVVAPGVALVAVACGTDGTSTSSPPGEQSTEAPASPLATKTVEAGAVTVKIDPVRVELGG